MREAVNYTTKEKQQTINAMSISIAKVAVTAIGMVVGKKSRARIEDFLPFEKPKDDKDISKKTVEAMEWALKNEKLPPAIVGIIGAELA